ncbi:uncharacterized protein LOC116774304 [Danaus plexippus]|uniref:uncharacterized protein LOC116774304 n=1 Tax=Danaus plexippus TaxID=13037 RepID=UPI002AB00A15|nr:uncharacterized protein LOC116774304 [Danaus plexippus]
MSKRYIPQQNGIRKKAKLDITVSDHNFPLSQNTAPATEINESDIWDDEIDDEVVLLASQAYEKAISGQNNNELPNYSVCMNPPSTSTQIHPKPSAAPGYLQNKVPNSKVTPAQLNDNCERNSPVQSLSNKYINNNNLSENVISDDFCSELPNYSLCMDPSSTSTQKQIEPSTSRNCFQFKKPTSNQVFNSVSTKLNDKCEKISSPLRAMSKVCKTDNVNTSEDLIFNNVICKGQDSDQVYRQLLQLKEENEKLKLENGKLLEKCVTKEGEASILRTQLKTCQIAVDNARMEKIKAQEKVQMDWSEKLSAANKQLGELRTQLDFKNLEIISAKEKCKLLESNKVRLTQVKAGSEMMSQSYNNNRSGVIKTQSRRVKKISSAVQTDDRTHFLKLNISYTKEYSKLSDMLPHVMDDSCKQFSILEYNEKLMQQDPSDKCRIYTTFHRLPITSQVKKTRKMFKLNCLYEDLSHISTSQEPDLKKCLHVMRMARDVLQEVHQDLETIQERITTAFIKDMDEVYMETTGTVITVTHKELLCGKSLYKEEQGVQARRLTAVLVYILKDAKYKEVKNSMLQDDRTVEQIFIELINKICVALDRTSTSTLYSGLLLSMTFLLQAFVGRDTHKMDVVKNIILCRPMGFVICEIIKQIGSHHRQDIYDMCDGNGGNLKLDHEQGVLLYRRDSCALRVVLEQMEVALRCIERQCLVTQAVECGRGVLRLYSTMNSCDGQQDKRSRCECRSVLMRVMVYTLKICAQMWTDRSNTTDVESLRAVCQYGVQVLYLVVSVDTDCLTKHEGPLIQMCHMIKLHCEEMYSNMISEIISALQSASDETPQSYNKQAWIHSFQTFAINE